MKKCWHCGGTGKIRGELCLYCRGTGLEFEKIKHIDNIQFFYISFC